MVGVGGGGTLRDAVTVTLTDVDPDGEWVAPAVATVAVTDNEAVVDNVTDADEDALEEDVAVADAADVAVAVAVSEDVAVAVADAEDVAVMLGDVV